jgi:hypothetical protein
MLTKPARLTIAFGASLYLLGIPGSVLAETQTTPSVSGQAPAAPVETSPVEAPPAATPAEPTAPQPGAMPDPAAPQPASPGAPGKPADGASRASELNAMLADSISNMDKQVESLKALDSSQVKTIRAVNVQTLLKEGGDSDALKKAMTDNKSQIASLQDALNQNGLVKKTLTDNNIPIERVVAVNVMGPGDLVVFYM